MIRNVFRSCTRSRGWVTAVALILAVLAATTLAPSQALAARAFPFITIGTASAAGAYYPLGVAMADIWNRAIPGIVFSALETGGSVANMNLIAGGEAEVGIANENIAYDALKGNAPFNRPLDIVGGWVVNDSQALIIALRSSGLKSVDDLRGKRISFGAPGATTNVLGELVLQAHGLTPQDYTPVYLGWQEAVDALSDGLIDAAWFIGGQPFPVIQAFAMRTPVTVLTFDAQKFRAVSSYPYTVGTIPASMYNLEEDGQVIVVRSLVYLDPRLPEDLVYEMVKHVFANIDVLKAAHTSGDQAALLSEEQAADIELPIHPGVVRYALEVGKW